MRSKGSDPYFDAIEQLFKVHYKTLKTYAVRIIYDADIAEDIVQDVFLELWSKQELIKFDENVKSYLFKAVYNRSAVVKISVVYMTNILYL